ncbi:unnamed protein product [Ambrosiozyma monospora]|uniref:Unnamed protein product n=1 Tax=Ambrosiozyma monospora TaxID=43982 RepID=A0ACB5SS87_AMBMO|nr:unnamed protein product [Ambrosiozyma monospora]
MQLTVKEEELIGAGTTYWDCLKGTNLRRTRIAAICWLSQNITGSTLMSYSTYFYVQAGLDTGMSFTFSIIQYILGFIGTIGSWFLSIRGGRFQIFFGGLCTQAVVLLIVGGLGCSSSKGASWGTGSMLLVFTFVYDLTVGPITYCIVSEMPSVQMRTKTIIIARNLYNVAGIVLFIVTPYMLNPTAWNWKAKTGFFWAGFAIACATWAWFDLPETKGRTFAELDKLFDSGISARKFKSQEVETFNSKAMLEKAHGDEIKNMVEHTKQADNGIFEKNPQQKV